MTMNQFEIDKRGIPRLSADDIESKSETVIEFFAPEILTQPSQTPLLFIAEETSRKTKVSFDFSQNLGNSSDGHKILGLFRYYPRTIQVDKSLSGDIRFPFILAHEFGHFVLHRNIAVENKGYSDVNISDTKRNFVTGKKFLLTPRDWLEWQANRFANALLMPQATIRDALVTVQKSIGINHNVGHIYLEAIAYSLKDFEKTLLGLQAIYKVSKTNLEHRLKELGLLVDRRNKDIKHISELLMVD